MGGGIGWMSIRGTGMGGGRGGRARDLMCCMRGVYVAPTACAAPPDAACACGTEPSTAKCAGLRWCVVCAVAVCPAVVLLWCAVLAVCGLVVWWFGGVWCGVRWCAVWRVRWCGLCVVRCVVCRVRVCGRAGALCPVC